MSTQSKNEPLPPETKDPMVSINEPPGSQVVAPPTTPPPAPEPEPEPLPSPTELEAMTRAELDHLADERGVDVTGASNKHDVIEALRKDARKRRNK